MNLQILLNTAAKKFGYTDYEHAQKGLSKNNKEFKIDWSLIDELILGEDPNE